MGVRPLIDMLASALPWGARGRSSGSRCALRGATALLAIAASALAAPLNAQSLDPRAYVSTPVGSNVMVLGITRSQGGVLVDPSLPVEDVRAKANVTSIGYARVFGLLGHQTSVYAVVPYAWGDVSGKIGESQAQTSRSGLADAVVRFNFHFVGGQPLTPMEFVKAPKRTIVAASLTLAAPTGQYYPEKLINLGTNRWGLKPEVGVSHPVGRWTFDVYGAVWFFTTNSQFYPGTAVKEQRSVASAQAHISYNLTLRAWAAFDATWYSGGRTSLNGVPKADLQNNTRMGATLSLPVGKRYSLKAAYSWDVATAAGSGFDTLSIGWQVAWLSRPGAKR